MPAEAHSFTIGRFDGLAVSDGRFNYPLESFFSNVPRQQLEAVLRDYDLPADQVATPYSCLFIDTGSHRVLVDTGAGQLGSHAATFFPSVDHVTTATGGLIRNLRAAGIEPPEIDTVIITHAHPDHIGGTLDNEGHLVFGNAHYHIWESEWDFWFSDEPAGRAPASFIEVARKSLTPLRGRVSLVGDEAEIIPGISAIAAPGHTPGHMALAVSSEGERLVHTSDTVLHPLHLKYPGWLPLFDMDPEQAAQSKRRIFDRVADEQALVFAHHFPPFPSLGYVVRDNAGWRWKPIGSGT